MATIQQQFAQRAATTLQADEAVLGLAVGGSWLADEIDDYSDLDLVLVTQEKVAGQLPNMLSYAARLGTLLNGFTGEHVGEPRLLVCLYDKPLLHVDIKFITLDELANRVEDPHILFDRGGQLQAVIDSTRAAFPYPNHQWLEDRFWIWVHYTLLKVGRGEYLEAIDALGFMRQVVLGPLMHIKNSQQPRGVRKAEQLPAADFDALKATLPAYSRASLLQALKQTVAVYQNLRLEVYGEQTLLRTATEQRVMAYFNEIARGNP